MTVKLKIGGTIRHALAGTINVVERLKGQNTARFKIREALPGTSFTRGQEVIIYDDARTESVLVTIDPLTQIGPPGLIWVYEINNGFVTATSIVMSTSQWKEGTFEVIFNVREAGEFTDAWPGLAVAADGGDTLGINMAIGRATMDDPVRFKIHVFSYIGGNQYQADLYSDVAFEFSSATAYRLTVTWDYDDVGTTTWKFYINGTLHDTDTTSGTALTNSGRMLVENGYFPFPQASQYTSDVRLWEVARLEAAIDADKFERLVGDEAFLLAYWKCDEMTGTTAFDSTANNYDGIFTPYEEAGDLPGWGFSNDPWTDEYPLEDAIEYQVKDYRYFGGRIEKVETTKLSNNVIESDLSCLGFAEVFDRRLVAGNYSSKVAAHVIWSLYWLYLSTEAIGVYTIPEGAGIGSAGYNYCTMRKALDEIVKRGDYLWRVDMYKELRYDQRVDKPAPFGIDSGTPTNYFDFDCKTLKGDYYNKIRAHIRVLVGADYVDYFIIAQDDAEIAARAAAEGGSGIYEHYEDLAQVQTVQQGISIVLAMLDRATTIGQDVSYKTFEHGLRPGMLQPIYHEDYDVDDDFTIESVTTEQVEGHIQYSILATTAKTSREAVDLLYDYVEEKSNFKPAFISLGSIEAEGLTVEDGVVCGDDIVVEVGDIP